MDILPGRSRRATPYLYSTRKSRTLMAATATLRGSHRQATYRTLIGLLAATGMRVGEAIGLDSDDFDADQWPAHDPQRQIRQISRIAITPDRGHRPCRTILRRDDRPRQAPNVPALLSSRRQAGGCATTNVHADIPETAAPLQYLSHVRPHAGRGSMIFGMALPSTPSLMAIKAGDDPGRRDGDLVNLSRPCQPGSTPTGISRPHRNC